MLIPKLEDSEDRLGSNIFEQLPSTHRPMEASGRRSNFVHEHVVPPKLKLTQTSSQPRAQSYTLKLT